MSWVTVLFTVFIAYRVNSGGLPPLASSNTPRQSSTEFGSNGTIMNTTTASGLSSYPTTVRYDDYADKEESVLGTKVVTGMVVQALNWLVTAFIGLIADSVERSNSTEPYEESEVEWKPY
uniref:Salivary secreted peptide n=1 Tax=Haemonchus contortus TaxID=6289 RepID=A0A7I5EC16_HAECO